MTALRRSTGFLAALLALFFLAVYLLTGSSDLAHNGDTDLRIQTTMSIVDAHHLWIAQPMWTDSRVALGRGGHLYAFYGPGQSVLMIPFYVVGKFLTHHLNLPYTVTAFYAMRSLDLFLGALLAVFFFVFALDLGFSRRTAFLLTLMFGLGTVAWPDAQSALEQTQVGLFIFIGAWAIYRYQRASQRSALWLMVSGCAVGLAIVTRYDALVLAPVIGGYVVLANRVRDRWGVMGRDLVLFGASILPWGIVVLIWNYARFGSPFLTGLHEATLGEPPWEGLPNLLVSPGKGLLWYVPLVLLLPWAVQRFARRQRDITVLFVALFLVPLAFYSNVLYWHGDPSWGPRYLYVSVPYLILPLGVLIERWRMEARTLRLALVAITVFSIALQLAAVSVTQWRFWYRVEVAQQATFNPAEWAGQPFQWGAQHYHYYWNLRESPIVLQFDNVYQVTMLELGQQRYRLVNRPDPYVSNPADFYPINSFSFWWTDPLHPVLGARTRALIALGLATVAAVALALAVASLSPPSVRRRRMPADTQPSGAVTTEPV